MTSLRAPLVALAMLDLCAGCVRPSPVQPSEGTNNGAPIETGAVLPRYSNRLLIEAPPSEESSRASDVVLATEGTTRRYARLPEGGFALHDEPGAAGLADARTAGRRTDLPAVVLHQELEGEIVHTALQVGSQWIAVPWPYGTDRRLRKADEVGCADSCVWSCEYEVRGSTMIVGCDWPKKVDDRSYIAVDWPQLAHPRALSAPGPGTLSRDGRYLISTGPDGYVMSAADGTVELRTPLQYGSYMNLRCGDDWYYKQDHEDSWHGLRSKATFSGSLACSANGQFLANDIGGFDAYSLRSEPVLHSPDPRERTY
jgi:hypothetical protein